MKRVVAIILALLLPAAAAAQSDQTTSGSITGNGQSVCLTFAGAGSGAVQVAGTFVATLAFTKTVNNANLVALTAVNGAGADATGTDGSGLGIFHFGAAGLRKVCVTSTAYTSGTATVTIRVSQGTGIVQAAGGGGGGGGGGLTDAQLRASPVPVSAASLPLPTGAATAAKQPAFGTAGSPSADVVGIQGVGGGLAVGVEQIDPLTPWVVGGTVAISGGTVSISGNVAVTSSVLPTGAATAAKQDTGNNSLAVLDLVAGSLGGSTTGNFIVTGGIASDFITTVPQRITTATAGAGEPGLVVRNIPQGTQAISAASLPLPSGAATDRATAAAPGSVRLSDGAAFYKATTPSDTQPVSGTVTANAGTNLNTSALALDATQTNRTQKTQLTDGTRDGTVKAASTAAAAADTSLVVGLSPNSPLPAGANALGTVAITGTAAVTGTVTANQGTAAAAANRWPVTVSDGTNSMPTMDAAARAGFQKLTDGTNVAAVKAASTAAAATDPALVVAVSPNNTVPVNQTQMNGVAVSTGSGVSDTGTQRFALAQEATYSAATNAKTATAAGTGVFANICGSASKTVRVQRITVMGTVATAAIYGDIIIRKTSAATTAGTATTLTNAPYDSNSAAGTAVAKFYTVLGTAGATVGNVFAGTYFFPLTGTVALMSPQLAWTWRDQDAEAPTLRGTAQCLELAFGTTPTNAPTLTVGFAWTEK